MGQQGREYSAKKFPATNFVSEYYRIYEHAVRR
jgi:hypothetical protein